MMSGFVEKLCQKGSFLAPACGGVRVKVSIIPNQGVSTKHGSLGTPYPIGQTSVQNPNRAGGSGMNAIMAEQVDSILVSADQT